MKQTMTKKIIAIFLSALLLSACGGIETPISETTTPAAATAKTTTTTAQATEPPAVHRPLHQPPEPYQPSAKALEIENMTDEEFLDAFMNDRLPAADIYKPDDFGAELIEGEMFGCLSGGVAYGRDRYGNLAVYPVNSRRSAERLIRDAYHYCEIEKIDYIGENEYYFSFRTGMVITDDYEKPLRTNTARMLVFRDDAVSANLYGEGENRGYVQAIRRLDKKSVTYILDLLTYTAHFQSPDIKILHREVQETDAMFIYTLYEAWRWREPNTTHIGLTRRHIYIDKSTGDYIYFDGVVSTEEANKLLSVPIKHIKIPG
jgi:hypothetical protein